MYKGNSDIYNKFISKKGQIAVLIDPEKTNKEAKLFSLVSKSEQAGVDYFFIGGSTVKNSDFNSVCLFLKKNSRIPVVIFPGNYNQISKSADAILYISLVSGQNPDYLINQHVKSAIETINLGIEIIPTAYILIDGKKETTVQKISNTLPIDRNNQELITRTAIASILQGKKIIYLEAGSGAAEAIPISCLQNIYKYIDYPIIIGGGIRTVEQIKQYKKEGANIIVIGTKIEEDENFLRDIKYYNKKEESYINL